MAGRAGPGFDRYWGSHASALVSQFDVGKEARESHTQVQTKTMGFLGGWQQVSWTFFSSKRNRVVKGHDMSGRRARLAAQGRQTYHLPSSFLSRGLLIPKRNWPQECCYDR